MARARATEFIDDIERVYLSAQFQKPAEASAAAKKMGSANVDGRIRDRLEEWRLWLRQSQLGSIV